MAALRRNPALQTRPDDAISCGQLLRIRIPEVPTARNWNTTVWGLKSRATRERQHLHRQASLRGYSFYGNTATRGCLEA